MSLHSTGESRPYPPDSRDDKIHNPRRKAFLAEETAAAENRRALTGYSGETAVSSGEAVIGTEEFEADSRDEQGEELKRAAREHIQQLDDEGRNI